MGYVTNKRRFKGSAPTEFTVTITVTTYINHSGGSLVQTNLSGPMTPVTLSPADTYRIDQPTGGSGITVTADGNNFVISGTPTADVTIACTTTRNPDLFTSTQKDVSNWVKTRPSANYGYLHSVSSTRINWQVNISSGSSLNEAYYIELPISQGPAGNYIFEIRYRITDLSQLDDGCRIGISSSNSPGFVNNRFISYISILDTQTTYTNISVPYTRSANQTAYLAITNQKWSSTLSSDQRKGRIYLDSISLREV